MLDGLVEHSYLGIDACSKVQHLLKGIKTMAFDNVKTRIILDATLRIDFDACVNLFQDFIEQCSTTHTSQQLQEVQLAGITSTNPVVAKWKISITRNMNMTLPPEQKKILHDRHEQQGHKRGAKDSTYCEEPQAQG